MTLLLTLPLLALAAPAPAPSPDPAPDERQPPGQAEPGRSATQPDRSTAPTPAQTDALEQEAQGTDAQEVDPLGPPPEDQPTLPGAALSDEYMPPFPSEPLELSTVLQESVRNNYDIFIGAVDIEINEALVLQALGAYDVFLTGSLFATATESPQRGSSFQFALASRAVGGSIGFERQLETGGFISLELRATRGSTDQPINPFDASLGATTLNTYTIAPTLTLTHPLLQGAGLEVNQADINKAKIATNQSEAVLQFQAEQATLTVINTYWDVLFAHRDLENRRRSVAVAEEQLERTRALVTAGRVSPVDVKAVEQALAAREGEVLTAENTLLDRSVALRETMGQQFAQRDVLGVLPMSDPVVRPRTINVRAEVDRAMEANPQIRQLELAIASRRIDELVAANLRLPQLDFQGTFTPQGRSVDFLPDPTTGDPGREGNWGEAFQNIFSEDIQDEGLLADWTVQGTLSLRWDIQNRGPKGAHEAAKLQIKRAELQLEQAKQQIAANVIRAANSVRTAGKQIDVARVSLELAEDNLAAEQARYEVGRATNFDVLQRLDELDDAAAQALNAQISYLKALVQLQALNGEILPSFGLDV